MADISKITLPNGTTYNIKDEEARAQIAVLEGTTAFMGVTTTALTDGSTTMNITIDGKQQTAVNGNMAIYGNKEFITDGKRWYEFGDLTGLGGLATKDSASGNYTPAGSISQPTTTAQTTDTTVSSITDVGTLPSFTVSGETLTLTAGTLPTKGTDKKVLTGISSLTTTAPKFTGTGATITVK